MTIIFAPYRQLRSELSKLETLYFASLHAYKLASEDISKQKLNPTKQIVINTESFDGDPISVYPSELQRRLQGQLPKSLREIIFVRVISILEVFMIESLKEIFIERRELFHSQEMIEFTQGEILSSSSITVLWTKFINKELRRLQNQSLKDKAKYFKKKINIDFNKYEAYPHSLIEIHDRRNLLVHRLGKADTYFKRQYNHKNKKIDISHEYLIDVISTINGFAEKLTEDLVIILSETDTSKKHNIKYKVKINIEKMDASIQGIFKPEFCFAVEDDVILLADIIEFQSNINDRIELILSGDLIVIKGYIKILKKYKQRSLVEFIKQPVNNGYFIKGRLATCNLPNNIIREIATRLPVQPWPQGIHKKIAEHYKTSNRQIEAAITLILSDAELYKLFGSGEPFI